MFKDIETTRQVYITQKLNDLQCKLKFLPCCIQNNEYKLSIPAKINSTTELEEIGVWEELSTCSQKSFCCQNRAFRGNLSIQNNKLSQIVTSNSCHCNCFQPCNSGLGQCFSCPLFKPTAEITSNLLGLVGGYCGKLQLPYFCFNINNTGNCCGNMKLEVYDSKNELKYKIKSSYCQKSACFDPCRIKSCEQILYEIFDKEDKNVGKINNIFGGCYQEICTNQDQFMLTFPQNSNLTDKILLINATIWLDYLHYNA